MDEWFDDSKNQSNSLKYMIDNIRKSKFSFSRESPRLAKLDLFKNQLKGMQHNNLDDFI